MDICKYLNREKYFYEKVPNFSTKIIGFFILGLGRAAGRAFGENGRASSVRPSTIFPGSVVH